jgi:GTP cyclohydrolase I|tara:strand:+ start:3636 stop:4247 length:612 start_codon:yes stop_codon:yes gene_type:complete
MSSVITKKNFRENLSKDISREEAEKAVEYLIRWAGDDPTREGLKETPKRVVRAFEEFFSGYKESPEDFLSKTFEDVQGYEDLVMLKDISFHSHCEHHMVPIIGNVHLAYIPIKKVVGISKLARTVDIFAKRLQTQETMTQQIANCIEKSLKPKGVAVYIEAFHQCMTTRGVSKPNVSTITSCFLGEFKTNRNMEQRFINYITK